MGRLTDSEFILRSIKKHGDVYDYSNVKYINCMSKVVIICDSHGVFEQTPLNHMNGHGCRKCANETTSSNQRKHLEFIQNANIIYGGVYDYSKVEYKNRVTKVKIICSQHGVFLMTPVNHITKNGCPKCSIETRQNINCIKFIENSRQVHKNSYCYDMVEYKTDKLKVQIICNKHGSFIQQPRVHLSGSGCPTCSSSKGELSISEYLNENNIYYISEYKFEDCVHVNNLVFDFYIPGKHICIEFDGKQHFQPIAFFGGDKGFELTKKRDTLKNSYCTDNNIKLIRIPYTKYQEISKILKEELWVN